MKNSNKAILATGVIGTGVAFLFLIGRGAEAHPEDIILSDLVISPSKQYVGEPVTISLIATNTGEEKATREIVCEVI